MRLQRDFDEWFVSEYGDGPAAQAIKTAARMAWHAALDSVVPEDTRPEVERKDYALLMNVASRIRNSFEYNPGHSDLDNEQPIHLRVTLREWRELNYALNVLQREPQSREGGQ